MMNVYLPDDRWDELRDRIALRGLTAEEMMDPDTVELAKPRAAELLADMGIMPESCRADCERLVA